MIRKNYKESESNLGMRGIGKRGQVTIFVVVAIVLVVAIALIVFFFPNVKDIISGEELSPTSFLRSCMKPVVEENVDLLSKQGGYANPEGFVLHEGEKVKYLCYTAEYYKTCVVQQPMIKARFEKELNSLIQDKAEECLDSLENSYERRGFSVSASEGEKSVEIRPNSIKVNFANRMTVTKEDTRTFDGFEVDFQSKIYDLLLTAQSIIDFESNLVDSETTLYLQYYPNLLMEKDKLGDGTNVYKLTDVTTGDKFAFASRSLAWPPGFGAV